MATTRRSGETRRIPAAALVRARIAGALALAASPRRWSEFATRLTQGDRMHQRNSQTWPDRYPRLFAAARELLAGRNEPRLLSYGCASGEEAVSLRHYFPDARIIGAEINRHLLRSCRRLPAGLALEFAAPDDPMIAERAPYDAIFCMAVLTRRPHEIEQRGLVDISRLYPFDLFEREIVRLSALLRPGGLLVVEHALYRVEDAAAAAGLSPIGSHGLGPAKGPRFEADGSIIAPQPVIARIFRKGAA